MRSALFAAVAALSAVASARPNAVTADITPTGAYPAGCTGTYDGTFELSVINASTVASKKMKSKRTVSDSLVISLTNGVLTDAKGRTGYIAANQQFQFDDPPQAGAIYTGGFSVCGNSSLALGSSAIWYECLSGTFYNLYEDSQGAQCYGILLDTIKVAASSSAAASVGVSTDGQITATSAASAVTQITDGQIQASSAASYTSSAAIITQITDGQIQASSAASYTTPAVVSQITDGQIQATSAASYTSSAAVISQISDGQIQATSAAAATTSAVAVVSQITDGQIQATTAANATSTTLAVYTGGAAMPTVAPFFLAAAGLAAALL